MEKKFEYVIKVDGKEVWRGMNPKEKYWEIKKANPDKEVSLSWETKEETILVAILRWDFLIKKKKAVF